LVKIQIEKNVHTIVSGLTVFRQRILSYFGSTVMKIYGIDPEPALTHRQYILE